MTILKKQMERWFLTAARELSSVFPGGDIAEGERPDFRIQTGQGTIGIEVTQLFRPRWPLTHPNGTAVTEQNRPVVAVFTARWAIKLRPPHVGRKDL